MNVKLLKVTGRILLGLAVTALAPGAVAAGLADEALSRPALAVRQPGSSVVLGAAQAGARLVVVGERGLVLLSDDQGKSWRQGNTPVSVTLTAVRFYDASNGVVVGHGGTVLTTVDGGQNWILRLDGRRAAAIVLEAARAAQQPAAIEDAQRLVADGPDKPLFDVLMLSQTHLLAVGAYGLALESGDGGLHWQSWVTRFDNPKSLHYYAVRKLGNVFLIAGEQGMVQLSRDGGQTFRRIETPYRGSFFTAELPGAQELVLAGLRGNVWRSRDDGQSWTQLNGSVGASVTGSALLPDGRLVLCNQAGMLLQSEGERLQPLEMPAMPAMPALNGILAIDDHRLVALTNMGAAIMNMTSVKQGVK